MPLSGEKFLGRNPRLTEIRTTFFLSLSNDEALLTAFDSGEASKLAEGRKGASKTALVKVRREIRLCGFMTMGLVCKAGKLCNEFLKFVFC